MDLPPLADPPSARRSFQFSLRTFFIFSMIVALFLAGVFSTIDYVRALTFCLWTIFYCAVLLATIIYGHGYIRSFCVGALATMTPLNFASLILFVMLGENVANLLSHPPDFSKTTLPSEFRYFSVAIYIGGSLVFSAISGVTVVLIRWMIDSANRRHVQAVPPAVPNPMPESQERPPAAS
jgi:hypothetical protein